MTCQTQTPSFDATLIRFRLSNKDLPSEPRSFIGKRKTPVASGLERIEITFSRSTFIGFCPQVDVWWFVGGLSGQHQPFKPGPTMVDSARPRGVKPRHCCRRQPARSHRSVSFQVWRKRRKRTLSAKELTEEV